jgi:hypothetical protein
VFTATDRILVGASLLAIGSLRLNTYRLQASSYKIIDSYKIIGSYKILGFNKISGAYIISSYDKISG